MIRDCKYLSSAYNNISLNARRLEAANADLVHMILSPLI